MHTCATVQKAQTIHAGVRTAAVSSHTTKTTGLRGYANDQLGDPHTIQSGPSA